MRPLADAAKCRSESDWLVGLNATRALTCFNSRHGGFNITAAGRVQTPTLAILAAREAEIQAFNPARISKSTPLSACRRRIPGKWIDEHGKRIRSPTRTPARADLGASRRRGDQGPLRGQIRRRHRGKEGATQIAPQLYDLTTLQREAPFSAKGTLQIAQALYEKHKVITYPRTDSRYLPEDYTGNVRETMQDIANSDLPVAGYAAAVLKGTRRAARACTSPPGVRQQEGFRPLRHHPHRQDRQTQRHRAEGL
jgi:DNA topoisomerase III